MIRDYDYYIIKVDEVRNGTPMGRIINLCIQGTIQFYDLGDMILKINKTMFNLIEKVKQSKSEELPTFHSFRELIYGNSSKYFFLVRMVCSDEISWHGIVEGSNCHRKGFKSVLDLMCKIDCALNNDNKCGVQSTREANG